MVLMLLPPANCLGPIRSEVGIKSTDPTLPEHGPPATKYRELNIKHVYLVTLLCVFIHFETAGHQDDNTITTKATLIFLSHMVKTGVCFNLINTQCESLCDVRRTCAQESANHLFQTSLGHDTVLNYINISD